jgi:hypothetical protein
MKKLLLPIILMTAIAAHAQGTLSFGVKGGLNFAHERMVNSGYFYLPTTLVSFHVGTYLHLQVGRFGLQPEVNFSRQGGRYNYPDVSYVGTVTTDYITFPLLATYALSKRVTLQAGPQFALLTRASTSFNGTTSGAWSFYKPADFGLAAGVTVELRRRLHVGVRYVQGLTNVSSGATGNLESKTTNGVVQLSVGYRIWGK